MASCYLLIFQLLPSVDALHHFGEDMSDILDGQPARLSQGENPEVLSRAPPLRGGLEALGLANTH